MATYPFSDDNGAMEAYMAAVEGRGPQTTLFAMLMEAAIPLPAPEDIPDSALEGVLWNVIHGMAAIGAFLYSTNHMSDRELYVVLWNDTLREDHPIVPDEFPMTTPIDILGGWSNEDVQTYLTYYADEAERKSHVESGESLPEHIDPPYRRDDLLPRT